jgi:hypothetical protein
MEFLMMFFFCNWYFYLFMWYVMCRVVPRTELLEHPELGQRQQVEQLFFGADPRTGSKSMMSLCFFDRSPMLT